MRRREFFRRSGGVLFLPLLGAARTRRATPAPVLNDIFSVEGIPDDPYYLQDDHHSGLDALLHLMGSTGVKFYRTSGTSPLGRPGRLTVKVSSLDDGGFNFLVADDGIGLPADFDLARTNSLGLQIVGLLVDQLEGSLEIDGRNGARFAFTFHEVREKSIPQPAH